MHVVHRSDNGEATLATSVRRADGFVSRTLGLMGRAPLEPGEAMVFPFGNADARQIHTLFVRGTIDVLWVEAERVTAKRTFEPWSIGTTERADTVIELPAGTADGVERGDIVRIDRTTDQGG